MLRVKHVSAVTLGFCLLGMMACSRPATSPRLEDIDLLVSNVTVIDSATEPQVANVLIDHGEIVDVIPGEAADSPTTQPLIDRAKRHIEGAGKYLIPGLWDFHVHFYLRRTIFRQHGRSLFVSRHYQRA